MAGILDDVMDGIAAKEKQTPAQTPATPPAETPTTPPAQPPAPVAGGNPMNTYSDQFKDKYGEKKTA